MRSERGTERIYWVMILLALLSISIITNYTIHNAYKEQDEKMERYKEEHDEKMEIYKKEHIYMRDRISSLNWQLQILLAEDQTE